MSRAAVLLLLAGCSSSDTNSERPPVETSTRSGLDLPGEANGIWWDTRSRALFLTDETNNQIVRWTDLGGFEPFARVPDARGLGGLVGLPDGRLLVTTMGFGTSGGVFAVSPSGEVTSIPKLDPARRRLGLTVAQDGIVFVAYFTKDGPHHGTIARLDLAGAEVPVVDDLKKPVGIAATATTLYITDQRDGTLLAIAQKDPSHRAVLARDLREPDLLTVLPDASLVTGSKTGIVYRIAPNGVVTELASGLEQIRGTAFDPERERLFVVERSGVTSRPKLHILPLDRVLR